MTKSLFTSILVIAISSLILIGCCIMGYFVANYDRGADTIRVDLGEGGTVAFEHLALLPGEYSKYDIELKGEVETECDVSLKFEEEGDKTLKYYVFARIEHNGEVIADKRLSELFEDDAFEFKSDLSKGKISILTITYYMPASVENEAQNAEADFVLHITAANEE